MTEGIQTHDRLLEGDAVPPSGEQVYPALRGMDLAAMERLMAGGSFPRFRARQLFQWVHRHGVDRLDQMRNLPADLRDWLGRRARLGEITLRKIDGTPGRTQKVVWGLADGRVVESVVMRDEGKGRTSLCISSQVGCAVGCTFCLTGYGGFQRHCAVDEIVGQVLATRGRLLGEGEQLHSLVFMGMGEPMLNLESVIESIRILAHPEGAAISPRRMTVSTAGVIPGIVEFGKAGTGANLAVSLNATTDETRTAIMPLNRRWPIADLIDSLRSIPLKPRQRITIEYVLMRGVNDDPEDAQRLVKLLRELKCKVNLIMFNPHRLLSYEPVGDETLQMFLKTLADARYTVSVRWSKGREVEAACGQLAAHYFMSPTSPTA
jgi:23S rRNA (adenine2503-C2)-methyltransferase